MPIGPSAPHGTDFGTVPCLCRCRSVPKLNKNKLFLQMCITQSISQCLKKIKKKFKKKIEFALAIRADRLIVTAPVPCRAKHAVPLQH
jgi:hypothetical protein